VAQIFQTFKVDGIPETRRGAIAVRNRAALDARACQCNDSVTNHLEDVLRGVYPTGEPAGAVN
jgi:hypothetical protein